MEQGSSINKREREEAAINAKKRIILAREYNNDDDGKLKRIK